MGKQAAERRCGVLFICDLILIHCATSLRVRLQSILQAVPVLRLCSPVRQGWGGPEPWPSKLRTDDGGTGMCSLPAAGGEMRCGGRRAGGEGAAVPLLTWCWVLQRGPATRDTGSDQAVCKRGLLCL